MHYITGTQFTVNSQLRPRQSSTGEKLVPGTSYFILKIEKKDNTFLYTFVDVQRNKIVVQFNSCREADKMIGIYRNERIPDYEAYYDNSTDI